MQKKVGAPRPTPSQRVDRAYLTRGGRGNTERARLGSVQTHNGAKRARATPRHTARARGRSPPSRSAGRVRVLAFSSGPFVAVAQGRDLGRETENTTRHPCGYAVSCAELKPNIRFNKCLNQICDLIAGTGGKGRCHSRPLLALSCRPRSSERVASTTARTEQTRVPSLRASPSRVRLKLRLRADAPSADCPPPNSVGLGRAFRAARACAGSARCVGGIGGAWDPIWHACCLRRVF